MFFNPWGWVGHVGFEGIDEVHEEDKEPEGRHFRELPPEVLPSAPTSWDWPLQSMPCAWDQTLPVQMESGNLSIVSLKVNEIEEVLWRLFVSLLSGKKEGIMPGTQTSAGSLRRQLRSVTRGKGKREVTLLMSAELME